jgi:2-aminoadipate transaminase
MTPPKRYAARADRVCSSVMRAILQHAGQPGIISLAGGLPADEALPVDRYEQAFGQVMATEGRAALQYGTAQGYLPLRETLAALLERFGIHCGAYDVLISSGSQQALDLLGKVFLDPGDQVLLEEPTYLGAIQAFNAYGARYTAVPMDESGLRVDVVERLLAEDAARGARRRIKLIYALPTFQNPSGRCLSLARRRQLVAVASRYGVPIVEDDAYGQLRYEGAHLPSLKSFDRNGNVIYVGTASKILAPGLRVGWVVAAPDVLARLLDVKQPADLHTATISQIATCRLLEDGFLPGHIERLKALYRERRDVLIRAIDEYFPVNVRSTRPEGGFFVWVELPERVDVDDLSREALELGVAFVPGHAFHADGSGRNTLRLSFSNVPPEALREGARRLGDAIRSQLNNGSRRIPVVAARASQEQSKPVTVLRAPRAAVA